MKTSLAKRACARASVLALVCAASAGAAHAQAPVSTAAPAADVSEVEAIVVTGFRQSVTKALDAKRDAAGIIDSIKAQDIAAFPDNNLAESIQRVPGVSITRDAGEGRSISVRGLGPQFTRVRINGIEALATTSGDVSAGASGFNRSRGFDFNVFASELFNDITVRKSASADVEEGSLGATVDLHTARPFDFKKPTLTLSTQGGYNDFTKHGDTRLAALATDTWLDGKLGVLVSAAYQTRHTLDMSSQTNRWDYGNSPTYGVYGGAAPAGTMLPGAGTATPGCAPSVSAACTSSVFTPVLPRYTRLDYANKRLGATGSVQYRPDDKTVLSFDVLYSKFDERRAEHDLEAISFSRNAAQLGRPETTILSGTIDPSNGELTSGVFNNVDIRSEASDFQFSTKFKQYTLNATRDFTDRLHVSALAGYSRSDLDNPVTTTVSIDRSNTQGYSYDFTGNPNKPAFNYGFDVTDPNNFTFANSTSLIRERPGYAQNSIKNGLLDVTYDLNDDFNLQAGFDYKEFSFDTQAYLRAVETAIPAMPAGLTMADITNVVQGVKGFSVADGTPTSWISPDIDAIARAYGIYSNTGTFALLGANNASASANNRSVTEWDTGGYVQLNGKTEILGLPIRGNIGARYVQTRQKSAGVQFLGATPADVTVTRSYGDWLPSLNLTANVTEDFLVRFAAAKTLVRPDLGQVTPGGTASTTSRTVSAGNPNLDPFRANTVDLSVEWYFEPQALLGAGFFYKDIGSFVQSLQYNAPFSTSGLPASLLAGSGLGPDDEFTFSTPVNTAGGDLYGVELSYQQPFNFLPGVLRHTGAIINYTYVNSKITYLSSTSGASTIEATLTGLSKNAANATVYYDDGKVETRLSAAYRGGYLTAVPGQNHADVEGVKQAVYFDMSASYAISPKIKATFEALNLLNTPFKYYSSSSERLIAYRESGRQIWAGLRFTF